MSKHGSNIEGIFRQGSIMDQACEVFSFRMDFYSKPNFFEAFFKEWDSHLAEFNKSRVEFNVKQLNIIQQSMVNIDAVAQALNTTIESIQDSMTYIHSSLYERMEYDAEDADMVLFVNPYFIQLYFRHVKMDEYRLTICKLLSLMIFDLWKTNVVSLVDFQMNMEASQIISRELYLSQEEGFGGYRPIENNKLCQQFSTHQFVEDRFLCVIKNLLSLVDVPFKEEGLQKMWQHDLAAECTYEISGEEKRLELPDKIIPDMIECCQKYIEYICVG